MGCAADGRKRQVVSGSVPDLFLSFKLADPKLHYMELSCMEGGCEVQPRSPGLQGTDIKQEFKKAVTSSAFEILVYSEKPMFSNPAPPQTAQV